MCQHGTAHWPQSLEEQSHLPGSSCHTYSVGKESETQLATRAPQLQCGRVEIRSSLASPHMFSFHCFLKPPLRFGPHWRATENRITFPCGPGLLSFFCYMCAWKKRRNSGFTQHWSPSLGNARRCNSWLESEVISKTPDRQDCPAQPSWELFSAHSCSSRKEWLTVEGYSATTPCTAERELTSHHVPPTSVHE